MAITAPLLKDPLLLFFFSFPSFLEGRSKYDLKVSCFFKIFLFLGLFWCLRSSSFLGCKNGFRSCGKVKSKDILFVGLEVVSGG